jgi:hypothetical protein
MILLFFGISFWLLYVGEYKTSALLIGGSIVSLVAVFLGNKIDLK